jgi:hypothetical protein
VDSSSSEEAGDDGSGDLVDHVAEAYNQNIYMMVAVPYSMLGILVFLVYRGLKRNAKFRESLGQLPPADADANGVGRTPGPNGI